MSESDGKDWTLAEPSADALAAPRPPSWSDTEEAYAYRRRAQAIRVESEVAEAKADALAGVVTAIRREGAP